MSGFLRVLEYEVQVVALLFLAIVYVLRLIWLFKFKSQKERTYPAGNAKMGIVYSMMNVTMPWVMESTRKKPDYYVQFVIFHIGVAAAISATFIIPYKPDLFKIKAVVWLFQLLVGASLMVGVLRLYKRIANPAIRLISSPDDYFSLILLIIYFAVGIRAIPNNYAANEWPLIIFFGMTAFFLIYVPFSKIGHYLYYPFTRYFLGRTMGHRGVIAKRKA